MSRAPIVASVRAQAKLNLFLRVLAREDSGFHQVETLFCRIGLADHVTVHVTSGTRSLDCSGEQATAAELGPVEKNIAWRAAVAYAGATGFPAGFEVTVEKRIPVGAGLGGGSADGGAVLRILNALNPRPLDMPALLQLATSLGADVPFLTQDRATLALGWGRGERLVLLPNLPASAAWILVPDVRVSTAEAYAWLDESRVGRDARALSVGALTSWASVARSAANDFEPVVAGHVPVVGSLLAALRSEALRHVLGQSGMVLMSGSGSAVAVIVGERPDRDLGPPPAAPGVRILETETATFVEPVVLTH